MKYGRRKEDRVFIIVALLFLFLVSLMWAAELMSANRLVFLEDERDLGNGLKLCIYTEGVTITVQSYKLCPISIEV